MSDLDQALTADVLPDCRARTVRGQQRINGIWHERVYCANCHKGGPWVPEEGMTFAYYLCDPCYHKMGDTTCTFVMPDHVFAAKMRLEMIEKYGKVLTEEELRTVVGEGASPLAALIKDRRSTRGD
jgi:hypothetical protein